MTIPVLPDAERRTVYSPAASTGPFDVGFELYGTGTDYSAWVEVWLDTGNGAVQLAAVTDWQLTSPSGSLANLARPIVDTQITLTSAATGTLQIVGAERPRGSVQLADGRPITADLFNRSVTEIKLIARELYDKIARSPLAAPGASVASVYAAIAAAAAAAGTTLAQSWATLTGAFVEGSSLSAKEWAVGVFKRGVAAFGSAKDWATYTGGTVDDAEYSSKHYAGEAETSYQNSLLWPIDDVAGTTATISTADGHGKRFTSETPVTVTLSKTLPAEATGTLIQGTELGFVTAVTDSAVPLFGNLPEAQTTLLKGGALIWVVLSNSDGTSAEIWLMSGGNPDPDELALAQARASLLPADVADGNGAYALTDNAKPRTFAANCTRTVPDDLPQGWHVYLDPAYNVGVTLECAGGATIEYEGETVTSLVVDWQAILRVKSNSDGSSAVYEVSTSTKGDKGDPGIAGADGASTIASVAKSADYTTVADNLTKSIEYTTSSSDKTLTLLSAATAGDGGVQYARKVDTGTGKVIVQSAETATVTIASPGVVTYVAPVANGTRVHLTTTGALPTGLTAGTDYYAVNASGDTFQLAATPGGSAINTTGSQSGTHKLCIELAWLSAQNDEVKLRSDATTWAVIQRKIKRRLDSYTTPGTTSWIRPPGAQAVTAIVICGGHGGASGARRASGTASTGGGGGGGAAFSYQYSWPATSTNVLETVVVGSAGAGGAAVTADDTNGNNGSLGTDSSLTLGTITLKTDVSGATAAVGGNSSGGGTLGTGAFGRQNGVNGAAGGNATNGSNAAQTASLISMGGGGGGAGQAGTPANFNGGNAYKSFNNFQGDTTGAGGVGSTKTNATSASGMYWDIGVRLGGSGGGGWSNSDGTAGAGADGTAPGGSGGGGGSSVNSHNSGKGGDGANGAVHIATDF